MKILLINPPCLNPLPSVLPEIIEGERGFNPPLGLLYIAGYLQKFSPHHEVEILDCPTEEVDFEKLEKIIKEKSPDVVGVSVMTFTLVDSMKVTDVIKSINNNIKIIWGGPHVNIYPKESLNLKKVDYIVLGEGEKTFDILVNNFDNEEKLKETTGLAFIDKDGEYINTGMPMLIQDLDEIPFPARNLINNKKYFSILGTNKSVTTMITSRGCPYKCSFCDRPHLGKMFRAHSAEYVVNEIKECLKYGIKEFLMYDDTFTIDKQRVLDVCDIIIKDKLDIIWDIRARVNTIDEEILKKLKQAGCVRIHYGVESGNQKILNVLRKGITLEQVEKAFALSRKCGIETLAYFMIGAPEEKEAEIEDTLKFMKKIKADYTHITILTPFPATDIYKQALEKGVIKKDVWLEFAKNPNMDFTPPIWGEYFSAEDLQKYIKRAYKSFYFRPLYLIKRVLAVRSWNEFKTKAKAGLKMLKI